MRGRGPISVDRRHHVSILKKQWLAAFVLGCIASVAVTVLLAKNLTPAQQFAVFLVLVFSTGVLWLFLTWRLLRLKAIILLALSPVAAPGMVLAVEQFGLAAKIEGLEWPAAVLSIIAILVLGILEYQHNRRHIVERTLAAFSDYIQLVVNGATEDDRLKALADYESDPAVDQSIFRMCSVMDLTYSRVASSS